MADARGFFQNMKMPDGFFRANRPFGVDEIGEGVDVIFGAHPIQPGNNQGVNNYVPDPTSATLDEICLLYTDFVNLTVRMLYPKPTGILRDALNANLDYLFQPVQDSGQNCTQFFPYGE